MTDTPHQFPVDPTGAYLWDSTINDWVLNPAYATAPLPPPAPEKGGKGRVIIGVLAVLVVLFGVATACGSSSGGTEPTAATPPPSPTASDPPPTPTPAPTPSSPVVDPAVLQQYADVSDKIAATSSEIADAATAADVDAMTAGCGDLLAEAAEGMALPDSAIPAVDNHWDKAMTHYADASTACIAGDYDKSANAINQATTEIMAATDAVNGYQG